MSKLETFIKKAVREAMLNEEVIAHKIVPNLSVSVAPEGGKLLVRFEDTEHNEAIEVPLDKNSLLQVVQELAKAAGVDLMSLINRKIPEMTFAPPIGEEDSQPEKNILDGFSKEKAKKLLYKALKLETRFGSKRFSDTSWEPIHALFEAMANIGLNYAGVKNEYRKENDVPVGKMWNVEIKFKNDKGRETKLYLYISANGCGTVEDPLSKYDVIAYIS